MTSRKKKMIPAGKLLVMLFFTSSVLTVKSQVSVSVNDFKRLVGNWQGSLTYLDYTSHKPFTMPALITVSQIPNSNQFLCSNSFPEEKNANYTDTLFISNDGRMINGEPVTVREYRKNGFLEISTETRCTDGNDNKPALCRNTYTIGRLVYIKKKQVLFDGEKVWLLRHSYTYKKKAITRNL
jgi:hypothetical protein